MALYGCVVVVPDGLMLCAPHAHPHAAGPRRASRPLCRITASSCRWYDEKSHHRSTTSHRPCLSTRSLKEPPAPPPLHDEEQHPATAATEKMRCDALRAVQAEAMQVMWWPRLRLWQIVHCRLSAASAHAPVHTKGTWEAGRRCVASRDDAF
jgi:hypothetical protein